MDEFNPQKLKDLIGKRTLEIVPQVVKHPIDDDADGVVFTLDGRTYLVFEDTDDGYRSCASPLLSFLGRAFLLGNGSSSHVYIHEEVTCHHRDKDDDGSESDILEVRSAATGEIIFEVGTENIDDYYPSYVFRWNPLGLSDNAKQRAHD